MEVHPRGHSLRVVSHLAPRQDTQAPRAEPACIASAPERPEFPRVYTEHVAFVWRVLQGMGVAPALVADAAQDVFVVVHRRLPDFDGKSAITTWLFGIAYRVASNYRRSQRRRGSCEPLDEQLRDDGPTPADAAERVEAARLALSVLDELDEDKRLVLVLAEIEQLSAKEISALIGTPLNTVYTHLRRARQQFNKILAARHPQSAR